MAVERNLRSERGGAARGRRGLRRGEILASAATLFAQRGFHGVSTNDIGVAAGMSGPAIYRHFASKEAVLADMLLDISQRLHAEGSRRIVAAPDAPAALEALLRWHIGFAQPAGPHQRADQGACQRARACTPAGPPPPETVR